jgi:hypothetical protein
VVAASYCLVSTVVTTVRAGGDAVSARGLVLAAARTARLASPQITRPAQLVA